MSDFGLVEAFTGAVVDNRRLAEDFRKGTVTAIDDTVIPNIITVSAGGISRTMPVLQVGVAVGNIVIFADKEDPFALGKLAGT